MKELKKLGLTDNEINIYLSILKLGETDIQSLSKISEVKRTTIYSCLEKLKKMGLVTEGRKNKKRVYVAENPEKLGEVINQEKKSLQQIISQKEGLIQSLIPQLKGIARQTTKAPKVSFYEGYAGVWNVADEYLKSKSDLFGLFSTSKLYQQIDAREIKEKFSDRRRQIGKTKAYYITDKHPVIVKGFQLEELDFVEYRFLPQKIDLDSFIGTYGDKIILFSLEKPLWGMIIESPEMVKSFKFIWDVLWKSLAGKNLPKRRAG